MLVLSRRLGETLVIGDEIKITILGTSGNQIRLGISAPKEVSVHREEVYRRIQDELGGMSPQEHAEQVHHKASAR